MASLPPESPRPEDLLNYDVPVSLYRQLDWQTLVAESTQCEPEQEVRIAHFGSGKDRMRVEVVALQERTANLRRLESATRAELIKSVAKVDAAQDRARILRERIDSLKSLLNDRNTQILDLRSKLKSTRASLREANASLREAKADLREAKRVHQEDLSEKQAKVDQLTRQLRAVERRAMATTQDECRSDKG